MSKPSELNDFIMKTTYQNQPVKELLQNIEVPSSAYEMAETRYNDLGKWFERPESKCSSHSPHVYPQGSFRLGTVIRPVGKDGEFDLDLGCRLRSGITKAIHTQKDLKKLVGQDLEDYRLARGIESELEEMHRCWRLQYLDKLNFHMDVVPSIPEEGERRGMLKKAMITEGFVEDLATNVAEHAGAITDDRHPNYNVIAPDWRVSNSEGYAIWFESRMRQAQQLLEKRAAARLDAIPARSWRSPLQQVVQLLKWHRDHRFQKNPDSKPISVIITTLAAHSYGGEPEVESALENVLSRMASFVRSTTPRVPNPINPVEDFADKWGDSAYAHLALEENFWRWLQWAKEDFGVIATTADPLLLEKVASNSFGTSLPMWTEELNRNARKHASLLEKAAQIATGAKTSGAGVIGAAGVSNLPHKFYGDETIHSENKTR